LTAISQSGIGEPEVKIKRHRAIAIVKDLDRCDSLKKSYAQQVDIISALRKINEQKEFKIQEYKDSEARLNNVISNYAAMQDAQESRYREMEKKYKREVRMGRFKLVLLGGVIAYGIYQSIK
jgi:hypothetical protein